MIEKVENTVTRTYANSDLNGKEIIETKSRKIRIEKVIKRKGDKLYVK